MESLKNYLSQDQKPAPITAATIIQRPKRHFTYINGDQYFGEYAVDVKTKQIFRHGCGSYVTSKCSIYQGKWTFDKLMDFATIKYPNKHSFCGFLDSVGNYKSGTYDLDDSCRVCGTYQDLTYLKFHDLNDTFWKTILTDKCLLVTNKGVV